MNLERALGLVLVVLLVLAVIWFIFHLAGAV